MPYGINATQSNAVYIRVQFLGAGTSAMSWAMQSIGWAEVGNLTKANEYLQRQLTYITNSFQVG